MSGTGIGFIHITTTMIMELQDKARMTQAALLEDATITIWDRSGEPIDKVWCDSPRTALLDNNLRNFVHWLFAKLVASAYS